MRPSRLTDAHAATIRACAEAGCSITETARRLGVSRVTVARWAARIGVGFVPFDHAAHMRALHADPDFAARRDARIRALQSDPDFAARRKAAAVANMRALRSDPAICARRKAAVAAAAADPARNPLAALTPAQRADYDLFKRKKFSRAEALCAIGRADLLGGAA